MSSRNQVVVAGAFGLAIALAAIIGAIYFIPSPSQTNRSSAAGGGSPSQGSLAVLLTDPPTVPAGVTAIYVNYSDVAVHVGSAGNQTGWTDANVAGTVDLMQMVNVSSTIATVNVSSGVYNALRFNVSSAQVTYNGANYTAFVPRAELTVVIPGGVQVNSTSAAGAIIDMHPTVLNIGSKSTPEFIVNTAASAFGLPPGAVTREVQHVGNIMRIDNQPWWKQISEQYTSNIQVTSASITNSSLSVTVKNTGTQSATLGTVMVSPLGSECSTPSQSQRQKELPLCFTGSAVFLVQNDSSLKSVSTFLLPSAVLRAMAGHGQIGDQGANANSSGPEGLVYPGSTGYKLAPGQSVTLTYSGSMSFGFAFLGRSPPGVTAGDQYQITAVGLEALAQTVVVAG